MSATTLPLDILWKVFEAVPKTPCSSRSCNCVSSALEPKDEKLACTSFLRELLALRLVCKDYSVVIKQLVFHTIALGFSNESVTLSRSNEIRKLMDERNGDGGITIRECIRSVQWKLKDPKLEPSRAPDLEVIGAFDLPNLSTLRLTSTSRADANAIIEPFGEVSPMQTRPWSDDPTMLKFVTHYLSLNALSTISVNHFDNVPVHALLSNPSLHTLVLRGVTFAPLEEDPVLVNPSVGYNLRSLTSIGAKVHFLPLLRYLPKLRSLTIDMSIYDNALFPLINGPDSNRNAEWRSQPPLVWDSLETLKFRGDLGTFHKMFKVEEASRAKKVLFPALIHLDIKDEPDTMPVAPGKDVYSSVAWLGDDKQDDAQFSSLEMNRLKTLVLDQSSWYAKPDLFSGLSKMYKSPKSVLQYFHVQKRIKSLENMEIYIPRVDYVEKNPSLGPWVMGAYITELCAEFDKIIPASMPLIERKSMNLRHITMGLHLTTRDGTLSDTRFEVVRRHLLLFEETAKQLLPRVECDFELCVRHRDSRVPLGWLNRSYESFKLGLSPSDMILQESLGLREASETSY
ncbi:hypothetical protein CVT24_013222 [Panaeolus cyanescens]|uniref:F-box domain-containing protein n=1 Tax=Panaeolus cyanescens TaxID=181874 RepID=A0A409YMS7_9AGAR|nr:hypothetical protein CVT24_013222 [Panaeolus cyanescens]